VCEKTKICKKCGIERPISMYVKDNTKIGGYQYSCKICKWFLLNNDKYFKSDIFSKEEDISLIQYNIIKPHKTIDVIANEMDRDIYDIIIRIKELNFQNIRKIKFKCPVCGKECVRNLYSYVERSTCSKKCKALYEIEYYKTHKNPKDKRVNVKCTYCGKPIKLKISRFKKQNNHFCSRDCFTKWKQENLYNTKEYKDFHRKVAINNLANGVFLKTNTSIQKDVNAMLDDLNIKYINEKNFKYFAIDNYLCEYNLCIEVMGTYWHVDHRKYNKINYKTQIDRIPKDKSKQTYITRNYNTHILYLWEYDINNYHDKCKELISDFVKNKGILKKYHSFNYTNDINGVAYMDMDIKDVNMIVDTNIKKERFKRDESKWIKYKCDYCGIECEDLICHYNNKINHCCSTKCAGQLNSFNHSVKIKCAKCGRTIFIKNSIYNKNSKNKQYTCEDNILNGKKKTLRENRKKIRKMGCKK